MSWDERLFDLLDDIEGEAEGLYAVERDAELEDRSRAEYATVPLATRLMASVGRRVSFEVEGVGRVAGELRGVGSGWCLVHDQGRDALVPCAALVSVEGLSERALPEVAWSPVARLGLGSALRRLAEEGAPCVVLTRSGGRHDVVLLRVGADFVEAEGVGEKAPRVMVALGALAAVRSSAGG